MPYPSPAAGQRPGVVLADHDARSRAVTRAAIERGGLAVTAEADDAESAVLAALATAPDVCVLEVLLPGDGVTAAGAIAAALPETTVVMLTSSDRDEDLLRALRAGAGGYLRKDGDLGRLGHALRGALAGETAIPRMLVTTVVEAYRDHDRRRAFQLTDREWEVLDLLRSGRSTRQVAAELEVSDVTVRRHISSLVHKLGVADRRAAIAAVIPPTRRFRRES